MNDRDKHSSLIHGGRLQPCSQILGTDDRDEHSSLVRYGINSIIKKLDMDGIVIMLSGIMLNAMVPSVLSPWQMSLTSLI